MAKTGRAVRVKMTLVQVPNAPKRVPRGFKGEWRCRYLRARNAGRGDQVARRVARQYVGELLYEAGRTVPEWAHY